MQHVISTKLPEKSCLHARLKSNDFLDCYRVKSALSTHEAAEIITNFPLWARFLVSVRNVITAPLGLLKEAPEAKDKVGLFPVESETESELIAGFNDKHLNFRISVIAQDGYIFLSTWVHTHNMLGRVYLKTITPFHILIVRNALIRVKALSNG